LKIALDTAFRATHPVLSGRCQVFVSYKVENRQTLTPTIDRKSGPLPCRG